MDDNYRMLRRIMLATNKIDGAYYYLSRRLGIKENVLALLYALDDGEPHTQKQIGEDWQIPKTTINTNVRELTQAGYLTLLSGKGSREKIICLTERGKFYAAGIMQAVYEAEQAAIDRALTKFSPEFVDAMDYFAGCVCDEFQRRLGEGEDPVPQD